MKTDLIWESVVQENAGGAPRHARDEEPRARSAAAARSRGGRRAPAGPRVGEIRNPLWRKGGTVFGPQPRSYAFDLPKKVRRGALRRGARAEAARRRA